MQSFWLRWTINCAFGELAGIGIAGAIAFVVNTFIGESQDIGNKLIALFAMMLAGFLEGSLLGYFQWWVLKEKIVNLPRNEWVGYTVAVAVLGWFLGMLPSLFFADSTAQSTDSQTPIDFENPLIFAGLSIGMGLILGAVFGLFQWFSLKKYVHKSIKWIWANALGWGAGLGWIYLFASLPDEHTSLTFNILVGAIGGILAGLSVGAITGYFLKEMRNK